MSFDQASEAYDLLDDSETSIRRVVDELKGNRTTREILGGLMDALSDIADELHENLDSISEELDTAQREEERAMIRGWERDR